MADYGQFLWSDDGTPSPEALGLSPDLAVRLRAWHAEWEDAMYGDPAVLGSGWLLRGHELAAEIDQQLNALGADMDVYYDEDDDPRPMGER